MSDLPKGPPGASIENGAANEADGTPGGACASSPALPLTDFVTAGHAALFQHVESHRCDVCAAPIDRAADEDDGTTYSVCGGGLLVWSRGEQRRFEEPPLCATCAAAIGLSALSRWESEEDEG